MGSFIRYIEGGVMYAKNMEGCSLDQILVAASNMLAFSDCSSVEVLEVVHEGNSYEYCGWEPDMTFTFKDAAGEEVWSRSFPNWNH